MKTKKIVSLILVAVAISAAAIVGCSKDTIDDMTSESTVTETANETTMVTEPMEVLAPLTFPTAWQSPEVVNGRSVVTIPDGEQLKAITQAGTTVYITGAFAFFCECSVDRSTCDYFEDCTGYVCAVRCPATDDICSTADKTCKLLIVPIQ